jgi:hypothetical protein
VEHGDHGSFLLAAIMPITVLEYHKPLRYPDHNPLIER